MSLTFNAQNLMANLSESTVIIQDFAIIAGLVLFFFGLFKLKRYGETRTFMSSQMTMATPMTLIICGALLMSSHLLIGTFLLAFWGSAAVNAYPTGGVPAVQNMENAIIMFVRIIGICAFIRGWIILARSGGEGQQPGTRGKALIHIFSGLLLIHILSTTHLLKELMGFSG